MKERFRASNLVFAFNDCALKERLAARLVTSYGRWLGGFVTRELRRGAAREGFEVEAIGGGKAVLASKAIVSPVAFNKYGVDLNALEKTALPALELAHSRGRVLVFDELGPIALLSPKFSARAVELLFSGARCLVFYRKGARAFEEVFGKMTDTVIIELAPETWAEAVAAAESWLDRLAGVIEDPNE